LPFYPQWKIYDRYKRKNWHREKINGVNVYRVPLYVPQKITGKTRILHELSFNLNSFVYWIPIFFRRYDVVIGICPPMQMGLWPYIYKAIRKRPFIFHIQDLQVDAARNLELIKNQYLIRFLEKIEKFFLRKATIVSTISEGMKRNIQGKGVKGNNIFLLPNWVDTDFIKPLPKEQSLKKEFGFKNDDKIILYSGNMGEKQGLEIVINVAKRFKNKRNIHFVFVGEGAAKERLINMVKEKGLGNVEFFSLQPYEKLPNLMAMADLHLVLQKRSASDLVMPSKLTSILSAGGIAIVTAGAGTSLHDVVEDNRIAILIEPENEKMLYEAIHKNMNNNLEEIKANARSYAEKFLNKDEILRKFETLLLKLIQEEI
ncbi:MAG TPA: colanic acid biosynthesis glycosyltransferase WcaI, partial [Candidatus Moranbacteria bacterium]|nr:colanic acid biosynthesis glycosyltransferase WcaI [Candidatus Moranbacteria bacterium]